MQEQIRKVEELRRQTQAKELEMKRRQQREQEMQYRNIKHSSTINRIISSSKRRTEDEDFKFGEH